MAKSAALSFNLVVAVVSLLLLVSIAEGRLFASTPSCETVYGVETDDTCSAIQQEFNLTQGEFGAINPNLVCDELFVGQWLCIAGSA